MSEAFEELGTRKKIKAAHPGDAREVTKNYRHDFNPAVEERRMRNLKLIDSIPRETYLAHEVKDEDGKVFEVEVTTSHRKITFWPSSDSYYLHAKKEYGTNIPLLVEKILKYQSREA